MTEDKYKNIENLMTNELSKHYRISPNFKSHNTNKILVFSPHGGGIEKGTSEIVKDLSALGNFNFYLFEGLKRVENKLLHITSTNFNEPELIKLLANHHTAISIHGMKLRNKSVDIIIGGLNKDFGEVIMKNLIGFSVCSSEKELPNHNRLFARMKSNVTNKCQSGQGVQIEISEELRTKFFKKLSPQKFRNNKTKLYNDFINSLNKGILEYISS
jgi:phage replication-related protein YjqB (UPF0714/DUF867 family)